ncbi:MAG: hypothetical protein M3347_09640, partial [Armatimonadota bacterium]|nr:hypothetical protein [Armatimonadota bacterium]
RDGAIGEKVVGDTTYGDSTYSYYRHARANDTDAHAPAPVDNWQTFRPTFSGEWATGGCTGMQFNPGLCEGDVTPWYWSPAGGLLDGDRWDYHKQKMDFGSPYVDVNGNWAGTPTGRPAPTTITYTATVKDKYQPGSGIPPAAVGTVTANYVLTLHDEVEKVGDADVDGSIRKRVELVGSDIPVVDGEDERDESGVAVSTATAKTSGWTAVVGADVPIGKVAPLFNIQISGEYTWQITSQIGAEFPLGQNLDPSEKAIPYAWFHYNRFTQKFRHFEPAGEHKLYLYDPFWTPGTPEEEIYHEHQWDEKTSQEIKWDIVPLDTPEPGGDPGEEPIPNPD